MNFNPSMFGSGLGGLLGGLFGDSGGPYREAQKQYDKYGQMATGAQDPYNNAGVGALGNYQQWLNSQQNPSQFINDQMKNYNESDYAHNLTNQSSRAAQNAASASGLSGSTPMYQQIAQDAGQIASADQNQWLQSVLGINTQYGQGLNNQINTGQNAANQLTNTYNTLGERAGNTAYGQKAGKSSDFWNGIGGALGMIGSFL